MYIRREYFAGDHVLIKNHSAKVFGIPFKQRVKRMRETPEAMKKYNNAKRAEKLQLLIMLNFDQGFHITLDYPKEDRPQTYEEAEDNLKKCLYKTARRLKRQGKEFKYIAVTERGKKAAALHHHVIIEGKSDILEELMHNWGSHMKISTMYQEGLYKDLAEYLVKIETKEELAKGKSKYHRSRNLKKPVEKTIIMRGPIKDDPLIPKGFKLVENSLVNGFNEVIGVKHQKYMIERCPEPKKMPKSVPKGDAKRDKKKSIWESIKKLFRRR